MAKKSKHNYLQHFMTFFTPAACKCVPLECYQLTRVYLTFLKAQRDGFIQCIQSIVFSRSLKMPVATIAVPFKFDRILYSTVDFFTSFVLQYVNSRTFSIISSLFRCVEIRQSSSLKTTDDFSFFKRHFFKNFLVLRVYIHVYTCS